MKPACRTPLPSCAGVLCFSGADRLGQPVQFVAQLLQVGDRLLEDVPQDVNVDQAAVAGRRGVGRRLVRRAVVVIAQLAEVGADFVGHLQAVQDRIVGKQPAVVGVDAQGRVAPVDRPGTARGSCPRSGAGGTGRGVHTPCGSSRWGASPRSSQKAQNSTRSSSFWAQPSTSCRGTSGLSRQSRWKASCRMSA